MLRGVRDRLWGRSKPEEVADAPVVPSHLKWLLTFCAECRRVAWVGIPLPHVEISKEPVEQYVRVNMGRGRSTRQVVSAPLRIMMGKADKTIDRCSACGAKGLKAATGAKQIFTMTMIARREGQ
jgi:hypothetical protein